MAKIKKKTAGIFVTVVVAAVILAFLYPYAENWNANNKAQERQSMEPNNKNDEAKKQISRLLNGGSPVIGKDSASITVIEYGDYQCTYCYKFHQNTREKLLRNYVDTGQARFVFQDFPLNGKDSVHAAQAAYCAQDQGKYWQYHNELYNNWAGERTGWINNESLVDFATNIGLDIEKFKDCLQSKKYENRVLRNERVATEIGIRATPSFLVFGNSNTQGVLIKGNQPYEVFEKVLDKAN